MEEQKITFETAKLAKEVGFNIPTYSYFVNENKTGKITFETSSNLSNWNERKNVEKYSAPTQCELQKWLRENFNIHLMIGVNDTGWIVQIVEDIQHFEEFDKPEFNYYYSGFKTFEKVLEKGLQEALKIIIKNKQ